METTKEGLLDRIRPPRLEDAGLEDCALPPESIKEAFLKAASAVRSVISGDGGGEGGCVEDPWPRSGDPADSLVGIDVGDSPGGCVAEKPAGGVSGDKVVTGEREEKTDALIAPGVSDGDGGVGACVDGLEGLEIGEKPKSSGEKYDDDDDDEDEKTEKPIIVEGYAL